MNEEEQQEQQEPAEQEQDESLDSRLQKQQDEIAALRSELAQMRTMPHVVGSTPGGEIIGRQQLAAMSYGERVKFKRENPKLYSELTD